MFLLLHNADLDFPPDLLGITRLNMVIMIYNNPPIHCFRSDTLNIMDLDST